MVIRLERVMNNYEIIHLTIQEESRLAGLWMDLICSEGVQKCETLRLRHLQAQEVQVQKGLLRKHLIDISMNKIADI